MTTDLTAAQWKLRALEAESAVHHALFLERTGRLGSPDSKDTLLGYLDWAKPALIVRNQHRPIEVLKWAQACGCDLAAADYEDVHAESAGDVDEMLCSRSFLGRVCEVCESEDEEGPEWKPGAVLWPCPSLAAINAAATALEANEIARKLLAAERAATASEESAR